MIKTIPHWIIGDQVINIPKNLTKIIWKKHQRNKKGVFKGVSQMIMKGLTNHFIIMMIDLNYPMIKASLEILKAIIVLIKTKMNQNKLSTNKMKERKSFWKSLRKLIHKEFFAIWIMKKLNNINNNIKYLTQV